MPLHLLLTAHQPQALQRACELGCWLPLPLSRDQAQRASHLAVLSPGQSQLELAAPITALEPWWNQSGDLLWLPLLGDPQPLQRPLPLGTGAALQHWLPKGPEQWRLLPLRALLADGSLAELLAQGRLNEIADSAPATTPAHGPGTRARPRGDHARRSSGRGHSGNGARCRRECGGGRRSEHC
jgi:hypothetical protein